MVATSNLYFTKDKQRLVTAEDPAHRFWAYAAGETIRKEDEVKTVRDVKDVKKPADKEVHRPETK
jgi:hypothetical protein